MNKRILSGILAAVLCLSLGGCSKSRYSADSEPEIILPEPSAEAPNMIMGEHISSKPIPVALHYAAGDGSSFSSITRSLVVSPGENIYEEAIDALLYNASSPDRMPFLPSQVQVIDAEYSCGIVTVDLSLDVHGIQNEQEYLMLLASISNTLLSMKGVRGVNILVGGHCESIALLPTGTLTEMLSGITPTYAQYSAERDYFLESATGTITRSATLYFPARSGDWFIPELHEITFDGSDYASALIRALRAGPVESTCSISAIPEGSDLLIGTPITNVNSAGERVLHLNFSPTLRNYLALSAIEEWQLVGSVTLTLCSFIPELDAVRICIDGEPLTTCRVGSEELNFPNGLIRRRDCDTFIGSTLTLYLPNADGTLDGIERSVSMACAQSPLSLLYTLMDDILALENSADVFPTDVYYDDILGVSVENEIASVNLSANFYRRAQTLDAPRERAVVYSVVNTLCELDDISGVRFYIEGISAETLSGDIYLKSVLMPNPGIVLASPAETPEPTEIP